MSQVCQLGRKYLAPAPGRARCSPALYNLGPTQPQKLTTAPIPFPTTCLALNNGPHCSTGQLTSAQRRRKRFQVSAQAAVLSAGTFAQEMRLPQQDLSSQASRDTRCSQPCYFCHPKTLIKTLKCANAAVDARRQKRLPGGLTRARRLLSSATSSSARDPATAAGCPDAPSRHHPSGPAPPPPGPNTSFTSMSAR